ncbi:hypothetical protein C9374_012043 [Naegleria lovaniensis]|uniref:RCC1-like domain-containing protein n=1 Tax=Naegleria lovaniensis TaxID=51637 RepID=A0AA88KC71_NAELO|nr:uncharacterized protein C9374_012043 [Naegleria lovaniensis]KAG2373580.1 hypothetical protein C9374_012043 [Naegleria lovaniensis]
MEHPAFLMCYPSNTLQENTLNTPILQTTYDSDQYHENLTRALFTIFHKENQSDHVVSLRVNSCHCNNHMGVTNVPKKNQPHTHRHDDNPFMKARLRTQKSLKKPKNRASTASSSNTQEEHVYVCGYTSSEKADSQSVMLDETITSITASMSFAFFITNHGLGYSIGKNYYGQQGVGDQERDAPESDSLLKEVVLVGNHSTSSEPLRIKSIACSLFHSMLVTESGELFSTGYGVFGQLGLGSILGHKNSFTKVETCVNSNHQVVPLPKIEKVSLGAYHSIVATQSNGSNTPTLFSCGLNNTGCCGLGDNWDRMSLTCISFFETISDRVVKIQTGYSHTLFLTESGNLYGCGQNNEGQIACDPRYTSSLNVPTLINQDISGVKVADMSCGFSCSVILTRDRKVFVCGSNLQGGLYLPSLSDRLSVLANLPWFEMWTHEDNKPPLSILDRNDYVTRVHCGISHNLFETAHGKVYVNGSNRMTQLGRPKESLLFTCRPIEIDIPKHELTSQYERKWCIGPFSNYTFCVLSRKEKELQYMLANLEEVLRGEFFHDMDIVTIKCDNDASIYKDEKSTNFRVTGPSSSHA